MNYQYFNMSEYISDYDTSFDALTTLVDRVNTLEQSGWQSQGIRQINCTNTGEPKYTVELRHYEDSIIQIADAVVAHEELTAVEAKDCFWNTPIKQLRRVS